ncbi:helix-turn-helix domain-containing protein [Curtobacterium sp. MCSS17_015]|uniref:AraC family transcriptional regulator n=1 Tax=Curtobacterium sp. MCSS17_015 TaxID=2175666 RepID=UPI0015E8BAF0|nr:helix-turn-helix domain-containing protein [Curtobacterium sp. MCSS17_015]WIB26730.1 helix-turn-helix domain-containing protein [Curtobacterium sp. MCSS17_015]
MSVPTFVDVATTNADEAAQAISQSFGYTAALSAGALSYRQRVVGGDAVTIADLELGAKLQVDLDATDEVMLVQVESGTYAYNPWGSEQVIGQGEAFLMPPDQGLQFSIDHATVSTCSFSAGLLQEIASELWDVEHVQLREGAVRPLDAAQHWLWRRTVEEYRHQVLETPEIYADELLRDQASRYLVVSAITAFGLVETPIRSAAMPSAAVRRAIAYIDDHLQESITSQDIASAARLSQRGLSLAFQRERGQSPMQYVRLARVAGTRRALLSADPTRGDSVTAVAAAWGFSNPGRFSALYRATYGESPRETLTR